MAGESSADATSAPPPTVATETAPAPAPAPARRKFAIEPVETSSRSSRKERQKKQEQEDAPEPAKPALETMAEKPRRKFLPQPVEETSRSSRRGGKNSTAAAKDSHDDEAAAANATPHNDASKANGTERKPRKFAVEPVETVRRVRRRNTGPALQPGDKTDESTDSSTNKSTGLGVPSQTAPPANSPNPHDDDGPPQPPESRFSYANLARKMSRQSSMRKPTLEPISSVPESEESNFSKRSSQSSRSSTHEDDDDSHMKLHIPRKKRQPRQKESYEEVFNGYLLDMAARAAQKQLREQVAEAYPNERLYDPVDHFAGDRESDSDVEEAVGQLPDIRHEEFEGDRRESSAGWDAKELQRHKDRLEQQKREQKEEEEVQRRQLQEEAEKQRRNNAFKTNFNMQLPKPDPTRISPATPKKDPFGNAFNLSAIGGAGEGSKDPELSRMQDKARPPMLGRSLVFPKYQSPRPTLIDPLQRHGTRKSGFASRQGSGLWSPGGLCTPIRKAQSPQSSLCLWNGMCTADQADWMKQQCQDKMQTGIMTPRYAPDEDPFERYANDESLQNANAAYAQMQEAHAATKQQTFMPQQVARGAPMSPTSSQHQLPNKPGGHSPSNSTSRVQSVLGIDQLLAVEQRIEEEYPDAFVSQIYNYLSLGYPAIARSYDDELSRISKVSVEEIRRGDARKNTKGYVGAPEGNGSSEKAAKEECGRWRALRLYIREWARQQPYMMEDGADMSWGARARRGSWFS